MIIIEDIHSDKTSIDRSALTTRLSKPKQFNLNVTVTFRTVRSIVIDVPPKDIGAQVLVPQRTFTAFLFNSGRKQC